MSVALLTDGPYDFELQLPAPPIADPQLVFFVHPGAGSRNRVSSGAQIDRPSCGTVRFTLTWQDVARLRTVLDGGLRFQAPPLAGDPPVGSDGEASG